MQDGIGRRDNTLGADFAGGRAKKGEQFGGSSTLVLMGQKPRMAFGLPRGARLRDSLIGPGFVFVQLHDPRGFRLLTCQLDQSFFSAVSGS